MKRVNQVLCDTLVEASEAWAEAKGLNLLRRVYAKMIATICSMSWTTRSGLTPKEIKELIDELERVKVEGGYG